MAREGGRRRREKRSAMSSTSIAAKELREDLRKGGLQTFRIDNEKEAHAVSSLRQEKGRGSNNTYLVGGESREEKPPISSK